MASFERQHLASPLWLLTISLLACQTSEPATPTEAPPVAARGSESAEPSATALSEASSAPLSSAQVPADTRVADRCAELCARVTAQCAKERAEACHAQCRVHEAGAKGCEGELASALQCQTQAKESVCQNVAASSCTDAFLAVQRCQRGDTAVSKPIVSAVPEGFERIADSAWGVSMLMPTGAALDEAAKTRTWRASLGAVKYEVVEHARPKKLDDQALVKLVLAHVGVSCQKEMRVTGRVDNASFTLARFETGCAGSERLHGKLRIDAQRALTLLVRGSSGEAEREPFLDGIK